MIVRNFVKKDWNEVKEIYKQGLETGMATFQNEVPSYEEWDQSHLSKLRFVAEDGGKVMGYIVLSPTSKRECYKGVCEVSIYVHKDARKCGCGTLLMRHMIEESEKEGIWSLYSSLFDNNEGSIALHKKCGFRQVGYREKISREPLTGVWRSTVLFERRSKKI